MIAADILKMQAGFYRLLSALYRYPLRGEILQMLSELKPQADSPLADGLGQVQAALDVLDVSALEERLNIEMTRLMEGPGLTPAPPYASFYLNGQQLMGPSAQAARCAYLEWQALPEQASIPPDHVALELGFLAVLTEKAMTDDEDQQLAALRASHTVLREQVQPWLSRFCADLESNSREPFFAALARLTLQVIEADRAWLEDVLVEMPIFTNNG
jgi:TorA maturation chaperone TorD